MEITFTKTGARSYEVVVGGSVTVSWRAAR
jgi:hypothetical protein